MGKRSEAFDISSSDTAAAVTCFKVSIQLYPTPSLNCSFDAREHLLSTYLKTLRERFSFQWLFPNTSCLSGCNSWQRREILYPRMAHALQHPMRSTTCLLSGSRRDRALKVSSQFPHGKPLETGLYENKDIHQISHRPLRR